MRDFEERRETLGNKNRREVYLFIKQDQTNDERAFRLLPLSIQLPAREDPID